jgi:AraC family transcriptional regulator
MNSIKRKVTPANINPMQKIFIKNMVCPRCISTVEALLSRLEIPYEKVVLGEVKLQKELNVQKRSDLEMELQKIGFALIDTRMSVLVEKIKKAAMKYITLTDQGKRMNLSKYIASEVNYEYTYISSLFSSVEGITIEQFYILQRIEKVKELLVYDQLSLGEIADLLAYSSIHHLSSQFKKVTGLTPSHFKKIGLLKRRSIDSL